jgi:hypothetical protein
MNTAPFFRFGTELQKFALSAKEDIQLSDFTNICAENVPLHMDPYLHIVVEDFFKPEVYALLSSEFQNVKKRGVSSEKNASKKQFHTFTIDYDGYVYTPQGTLDPKNPLSIFFSLEWNKFFSTIFGQFTTFETRFAFHHHPAGDRTGFVHHDFVDKPFHPDMRLPNGVIYNDAPSGNVQRRRIISLIFYLNNDEWREGDGGETGIYAADGKILLKKIPPKNNTLFAFHVSPRSMHAFQGNKTERNSFVQWFHLPPELL